MVGTNLESLLLLAADAAEGAEAAESSGISGANVALIIAVLVVPFILGPLLARWLKMPAATGRIGVCFFALMLGLAPFLSHINLRQEDESVLQGLKNSIRLGIDLAGGTNLVLQADAGDESDGKKITDQVMDQMVGAVSRRINPSGTEEVVVRKVGRDRIEIIIPGADPERVREVKKRITRLGSLEFAILANTEDHPEIITEARKLPDDQRDYKDPATGIVLASWRDMGMKADGEFKTLQTGRYDPAPRVVKQEVVINNKEVEVDRQQYLVILDPEDRKVTGEFLTRAQQTMDPSGRLAVSFNFNGKGAARFRALTSQNRPIGDRERRLAILLDGQIHSAPSIRDTISASGQITGDFTPKEVDELIAVLNAGALEVPLKPEPISEFTVSPLIGADVIQKGMTAFAIAGIAVLIFMVVYYRAAGIIADLCLVLNIVLVMGTMSLIKATFTLPGLAGIVLTVGMAVDANVLIFERIREELRRGASLRMSIQNGFSKALSTIVDANVTTLITAVILFYIGTDQVRGFAVTLFIGIVMSMFSALYFGRLMFDILERHQVLKKLAMSSLVGETHWDFIGKRSIAAVVSAVFIVAGMSTFFARGEENLDIDFTGGTMVTFQLKDPATTEQVRKVLESQSEFGAITLERLKLAEEEAGEEGRYFRLRTTRRDSEDASVDTSVDDETARTGKTVQQLVAEAFEQAEGDYELRRVDMEFDNLQVIPTNEETEREGLAGGHTVELTFTAGADAREGDNEVTETTVVDYLVTAVNRSFRQDGKPQFSEAENLFEVEGVEGSGVDAATGEVAKFSKVSVSALPALSGDQLQTVLAAMQDEMASSPVFDEVNSFDSSVASEMQVSAILAILASLVAIVAYIWFRFQAVTFGLAAVVALVHDVMIVLGVVAIASELSGTAIGGILDLYDFRINLAMIAAFLTIVGYSLNDTIVVFDRIREVRGKNPALTEGMVNESLNQTLSRTLLTSLTTFLVVSILYFRGGEGIHGFAFCLVCGVIVGTYSSIYVASPVLIWLMNRPGGGSGKQSSEKTAKAAA